jgi:hypothetical protein
LITVLELLGFGIAISLIPGLYLLEFATASSLIAGLLWEVYYEREDYGSI